MSSIAVRRLGRFDCEGGVLGRASAAAAAGADEKRMPIWRVTVLSLEPSTTNGLAGGNNEGVSSFGKLDAFSVAVLSGEYTVAGSFKSSSPGNRE
jgi:hypothetical protein